MEPFAFSSLDYSHFTQVPVLLVDVLARPMIDLSSGGRDKCCGRHRMQSPCASGLNEFQAMHIGVPSGCLVERNGPYTPADLVVSYRGGPKGRLLRVRFPKRAWAPILFGVKSLGGDRKCGGEMQFWHGCTSSLKHIKWMVAKSIAPPFRDPENRICTDGEILLQKRATSYTHLSIT